MRPSAAAWVVLCLVGAGGCGTSAGDASTPDSPDSDTSGSGARSGSSGSTAAGGDAASAGSSGSSGSGASTTSHDDDASVEDTNRDGGNAGHDGATQHGAAADAAPDAAGAAPDGSITAIPLMTPDGTYYTAQVTIRSQTFAMDIDTGSATAAVAATGCTECTSAGVTTLYDPSSMAVDQHKTSTSMYADGTSWTGEVIQDQIGLGYGTPAVQLDLVSIKTENGFFRQSSFAGILGLGPSDLVTRGTTAYLPQEFAAGVTSIVAFELCASSGTMWLGGFDPSAASSAMQYTPLLTIGNDNPYYAIDVNDLSIGGQSLGFTTTDFQSPVVDTGTSLFYLPTNVFTAMVKAINGSSGFKAIFGSMTLSTDNANLSCVQARGATDATVDAQLPPMALTLPGNGAGAPNVTLTLQPTQSYLLDAGGGTFCLAAGDGGAQGGSIFGDAFLAAFVSVIDQKSGRVGFAPDEGCNNGGVMLSKRVIDLTTWHPRPPRPRPRVVRP